jgi:hypothetical protein
VRLDHSFPAPRVCGQKTIGHCIHLRSLAGASVDPPQAPPARRRGVFSRQRALFDINMLWDDSASAPHGASARQGRITPGLSAAAGDSRRRWKPQTPSFPVAIGAGSHPFPFRTRKLSLLPPMVLRAKVRGRVGRCRDYLLDRPEGFIPSGLFSVPSSPPHGGAWRSPAPCRILVRAPWSAFRSVCVYPCFASPPLSPSSPPW